MTIRFEKSEIWGRPARWGFDYNVDEIRSTGPIIRLVIEDIKDRIFSFADGRTPEYTCSIEVRQSALTTTEKMDAFKAALNDAMEAKKFYEKTEFLTIHAKDMEYMEDRRRASEAFKEEIQAKLDATEAVGEGRAKELVAGWWSQSKADPKFARYINMVDRISGETLTYWLGTDNYTGKVRVDSPLLGRVSRASLVEVLAESDWGQLTHHKA